MPENSVRPLKAPKRDMISPAMVPSTVAKVEEVRATFSVTQAALRRL
jgi:hypothetical protein